MSQLETPRFSPVRTQRHNGSQSQHSPLTSLIPTVLISSLTKAQTSWKKNF